MEWVGRMDALWSTVTEIVNTVVIFPYESIDKRLSV